MATWVEEAWNSRRQSEDQVDLCYIVGGTTDDATAVAAAAAVVPATYRTIFCKETYPDVERLGYETWRITYRYKVPDSDNEQEETDGYTYEFDTGGGTEHIQTALVDVNRYPVDAPPITQAINYANGHCQGIDIVVPSYCWSERRSYAFARVTAAYRYTLMQLTGRVNSGAWAGYAAGEVLFKGARGQFSTQSGLWEISYSFAANRNRTDLSIAGQTVTKNGWDHVQVRYADADDDGSSRIKPELIGVYVQQVYPTASFASLYPA